MVQRGRDVAAHSGPISLVHHRKNPMPSVIFYRTLETVVFFSNALSGNTPKDFGAGENLLWKHFPSHRTEPKV